MNQLTGDAAGKSLCPICGLANGSGHFRRGNWNYVQCRECGAIFLHPIPDEQELRTYYNETYLVPAKGYAQGTKLKAPPILRGLTAKLPGKGKLLELGCSYGFLLDAARRDGWDVTGIELDDGAATFGRDKLRLKVLSGTLASEFSRLEPPYDAIVAFHVIEHVSDPIGFLQLCGRLLRRSGVLILKTPNVMSWVARRTGAYWQWVSPPAHIHLFSPRTLELALAKCGFRAEEIWSQRGDAHNNLFELFCAAGRFVTSRKDRAKVGAGNGKRRKTWSDRWQVNAASAVSDAIYYPFGLVVDPWLGRKGLQPELVAIARG